jgi:hypothetical protein
VARLNSKWDNFGKRGFVWDHFWLDAKAALSGAYATAVIANNPDVYWRFDETSTPSVDDIAGLSATWTGGPSSVTGLIAGDANTAIGFSSTGQYLSAAHNAILNLTTNWSVEFWVNVANNTDQVFFSKGTGFVGQPILWRQSGNLVLDNNNTGVRELSGGALSLGIHHIVVTYGTAANSGKVYVDGADVTSTGTGATFSAGSTDALQIGAEGGAYTLGTGGVLDEFALWNGTVLSAAQVLTHYEIGKGVTRQFGQAQAKITAVTRTYSHSQSQALVKTTFQGYAQSNSHIKMVDQKGFAQAKSSIKTAYQVYSQTQADIKTIYRGYAQTQADIKQTYQAFAQAQAKIIATVSTYAQSQAAIKATGRGFAQAQAGIKSIYQVYVQSQADIKAIDREFAQSQAWIKDVDIQGYAQSQSDIKQTYRGYAQGNAYIKMEAQEGFAQAQAWIKATSQGFAQAQSQLRVSYQAYAQAQAKINTTRIYAQAQSKIKATDRDFAQAQAYIKTVNLTYAQAQADIKQTYPLVGGSGGTLVVYSDTSDGYIVSNSAVGYANARSGSSLASNNFNTNIAAGQFFDLDFSEWNAMESFLSFDTSSIGNGSTVSTVVLSLTSTTVGGSCNTINARLLDWGTTVTTADWVAGASLSANTLLAHKDFGGVYSGNVSYDFVDDAFPANVNKVGSTRLMLCGADAEAGTDSDNLIYPYSADQAGTTSDPKLTVTYSGGTAGPTYAQAQASIIRQASAYQVFAQAQASIAQIYQAYAQASFLIRPVFRVAQAQAIIGQCLRTAQAAALINGTYFLPFSDTFDRTVVNGLGTSDNGDTWVRISGTNANADVTGTKMLLTGTPSAGSYEIWDLKRTLLQASGYEYSGIISFDSIPSTGSILFDLGIAPILGSYCNGLGILLAPNGNLSFGWAYEGSTGGDVVISYVANDEYNFKVQVLRTSSGRTENRYKLWKVGDAETAAWTIATPGITSLFTIGHVRLLGYFPGSNAVQPVISLDNFQITEANITRWAQAQAKIKATNQAFAQAGFLIRPVFKVAQAQAVIGQYRRTAQAAALVNGLYPQSSFIDTFTRTTATGLGVSDNGDSWVILSGSANQVSVDGSQAVIIPSNASINYVSDLNQTLFIPSDGIEITAKVGIDKLPTTSTVSFTLGLSDPSHILNIQAAALIAFTNSGLVSLTAQRTSNITTSIGAAYTIGDIWNIKVHILRASNSVVANAYFARLKIWKEGTPEGGWDNSSTALQLGPVLFTPARPRIIVPSTTDANNPFGITLDDFTISTDVHWTWYGQAQARIKSTSYASAQAQATIIATNREFAQAQTSIKQVYQGYAQSNAYIKVTDIEGFAQVQAQVRTTYQAYAQAQAKVFFNALESFAQAQTQIKQTYQAYAQAQARIFLSALEGFAQAQADIKQIYRGYAQTQTNIKAVSQGYSQAQVDIKQTYPLVGGGGGTLVVYADTNDASLNSWDGTQYDGPQGTYAAARAGTGDNGVGVISNLYIGQECGASGGVGEYHVYEAFVSFNTSAIPDTDTISSAVLTLSALNRFAVGGPASYDIEARLDNFGATVDPADFVPGASLSGLTLLAHHTATSSTWTTNTAYDFVADALAANVNKTGSTQMLLSIDRTRTGTMTAGGTVNAYETLEAYSADAAGTTYDPKLTIIYSGSITGPTYAQSQAQIKQTYQAYAQAQSDIKQIYRGFAQGQADIKQTYQAYAQSQADIKQAYRAYAQAQGYIVVRGLQGFAQGQADIKQTYYSVAQTNAYVIVRDIEGFAQAQAWIRQTSQNYAQVQARIYAFGVKQFAQAQAWIGGSSLGYSQAQAKINAFAVKGYAQAQTDIKAVSIVYAQAQADIKNNYQGYAQTQTRIKTAYQGYAQAQADIKATYQGYAQAQTQIKRAYMVYAQAMAAIQGKVFAQVQAQIKQTYYVFAQAQADIKVTTYQPAQAMANVKTAYYGLAQSQVSIRQAYRSFAQAQTDIKSTYRGYAQAMARILGLAYAQANAYIKVTDLEVFAQSQASIKATYRGFAQGQADIKATYQAFAQTATWLKVTNNVTFAQAQSDIKQVYRGYAQANASIILSGLTGYAQAQAYIISGKNAHAQAQAQIRVTTRGYAQAQAWIGGSYLGLAQAQAKIRAFGVQGYAQAQSDIKVTYRVFAQAQASVKTSYIVNAQSQADIKTTYYGFAQAQSNIKQSYTAQAQAQAALKQSYVAVAQAQAKVNAYNVQAFAQAQASIRFDGNAVVAQAQSKIRAFGVNSYGQALADIKTTARSYAQAQADIKATYNGVAQAQAKITSTYQIFANTQATVKSTTFAIAQAQAWILKPYQAYAQASLQIKTHYEGLAQAQAYIYTLHTVNAQASASIKTTGFVHAQAQGQIKQTYRAYAQAQAVILVGNIVTANAQASIKTIYEAYAQAQALITTSGIVFAQAQSYIVRSNNNVYAQAQAFILKAAGYAQAAAFIEVKYLLYYMKMSEHNILLVISDREAIKEELDDRVFTLRVSDSALTLKLSDTNTDLKITDRNYRVVI